MASMKLRVRAAGGGPTIRVQIPLLCTLQGLKDILAPLVSLPASSFSLSLNKKDEIQGPGIALLSSFGVTSGDLLFYIVNSGRSSPPIQLTGSPSSGVAGSANPGESSRVARASVPSIDGLESVPPPQTATPNRGGRALSIPASRRELCAAAAARRQAASLAAAQQQETTMVSSEPISLDQKATVDSDNSASPGVIIVPSSNPPMTKQGPAMAMEIEAKGLQEETPPSGGGAHRLVPIPDLLQRVLTAELENIRQPCMLLVLAVHAVMLETGFVRIETGRSNINNTAREARTLDGYGLPSGWSGAGFVNLTYTLPELTRLETAPEFGHEVLLRCLIVGNAVVVYGVVTDGSPHRVSLSASKFLQENLELGKLRVGASSSSVRKLDNESVMEEDVESAKGGKVVYTDNSGDGTQDAAVASMGENIFRDIFGLWKEVKDSLSLPLLTFMCEKTGLPPPPSLLRLPTELKLRVMDALPPVALANLSCACSEFRFLASSDELWKQKYKEEFGARGERAPGGCGWKSAFVRAFEIRRRSEDARREAERRFLDEMFTPGVMRRLPSSPLPFGDYFQGLGAEPSQYNLSRGFRIRRMPSRNPPGAFPSRGEGGSYGEQVGGYFPRIEFDRSGGQAWPPFNNLRPRSGFGRLDGEDNRGGLAYPRSQDGRGEFPGLGPFS